jgi:thiosulfate/3-mercaptopyruvate sulfurtransferase
MNHTTFISINTLAENYTNPNWVIVDCHFQLDDPGAGRAAYQRAHIPGARYAHLDEDLSGPVIPGKTGRHPLPTIEQITETLSNWGIDHSSQVVVYDDRSGGIAGRLWWMLKWLGHQNVAVLAASFSDWVNAGLPASDQFSPVTKKVFTPHPRPELIASQGEISNIKDRPEKLLVDSRSPDRYRGENETLDPVAGHIPGAANFYFMDNLDQNGFPKPIPELKQRFADLIGDTPPGNVIFYCGSGVTAAYNILAMEHAGLGFAKIYPGSWSEWITNPDHQISTTES